MSWPSPVPSVRKQWKQSSYAVIPNGNWTTYAQGITILDNDDVWMFNFGQMDFQFTVGGGLYLAKVEPLGSERVTPDGSKQLTPQLATFAHPIVQPGWTGVDADIGEWTWHIGVGWSFTNDGSDIYFFARAISHGPTGFQINQIFRFNPRTRRVDALAGDQVSGIKDSMIGLNASIERANGMTYHDGYLWWSERASHSDASWRIGQFRRMKLESPFSVESIWPHHRNPSGYPATDGDRFLWLGEINSTTGLPNALQEDVFPASEYYDIPLQFIDNYIYFIGRYPGYSVPLDTALKYEVVELSRVDIDTGLKEPLYYGISHSGPNHPDRDRYSNHESTPLGVPSGSSQNNNIPYDGTWYYEGWNPSEKAGLALLGDDLIFANMQSFFWDVGVNYGQQFGEYISKINLPRLLEAVEENGGPIRHDRRKPMFETIANGTIGDEQVLPQNFGRRYRSHVSRDGYTPLLSHIAGAGGITTNPRSSFWSNKVAYVSPQLPYTTRGWSAANAKFVKILEPGDDQFLIRVKFNGTHLKGYINEAYAPLDLELELK